jgi:predicted TIM-barrel fold metal-dependent hydrolase
LHFDLQTPWWNLDEAITLARDFPRMLIILNHAGLPADRSPERLAGWRAAMARLAEEPNVRVKISGIGLRNRPWSVDQNWWIVEQIVAMFGASRAMFASNFPVDSLCGSFDTIFLRLQADRRTLFEGGTGAAFLRNSARGLSHQRKCADAVPSQLNTRPPDGSRR